MINLKQKIEVVSGKLTSDYETGMVTPTDAIPYIMMQECSSGLINASTPPTRRERRALKRKEKKHGNTK